MNRLEIYGDSLLKGVIYSDELAKYRLSKNCKYETLKEYGIEVHNNSRMGATVSKGLSVLQRRLDYCDHNTLVLFDFGGNDCDHDWEAISENPDADYLPFTPENQFIQVYHTAIEYAKKMGAKVAISSLVPIDSNKYMTWITKNRNYQNILHWLGDISMLGRWQEHYSHLAEKLAVETNCPIVDFRSEFLRTRNYQSVICSDGIHPTQIGYDMIENKLVSFIKDMV